jgi:hypothetical protein
MWRLCQGRLGLHVYQGSASNCQPLPAAPSDSQRLPHPTSHIRHPTPQLQHPSPTIHTCLTPCPCLFLVAVRHVSLSIACSRPICCTLLRALNARGPKGRVRDNTLLSLVQPPLFPATLWPPPRPAQPSTTSTSTTTTSTTSHHFHQISHNPSRTTQKSSWSGQRSTFDRNSQSQQGSCTAAHKSRRTILEWLGRTGLLPTGSFSSTPLPIQGFCTCNALLSLLRMQFFSCDNSISDCCTASKSPKSSLNIASRGPEQQVDVGSCP